MLCLGLAAWGYTSQRASALTSLQAGAPCYTPSDSDAAAQAGGDDDGDEEFAAMRIRETIHPSCTGVLDVRWINLASSTERRGHMAQMLDKLISTSDVVAKMVRSSERFEAVTAACDCEAGARACPERPCSVSASCQVSNDSIALLERDVRMDANSRAGHMGCWCSHYSALHDFVNDPESAPLLLLLEDDAFLEPTFFEVLPNWLAQLPSDGWDIVRFSTWNNYRESDRINPSSLASRIYHARMHNHSEGYTGRHNHTDGRQRLDSGLDYYMGNHVSLLTRQVRPRGERGWLRSGEVRGRGVARAWQGRGNSHVRVGAPVVKRLLSVWWPA